MPDQVAGASHAVLAGVAQHLGLHSGSAEPLRLHDARTFLFPEDQVVVRVTEAGEWALSRATTAIDLTRWLVSQGFPTVPPVTAEPLSMNGSIVTAWRAVPPYPSGDSHGQHLALGRLIRDLHGLPDPPVSLSRADPLARLRAALSADEQRTHPVLDTADHAFLEERAALLDARYHQMSFPLGLGLIHNDAHPGNLLPDPASRHGYLLIDWDSACIGPREMDVVLVGAPGSRFGDAEEDRLAFANGYGYDIAGWPSCQMLRDIRDLHALAGHLRIAANHPAALRELRIRVRSLRDNDRTVRWHAV